MNGTVRIDRVAATSTRFAAHHGVEAPARGATLTLGEEVGRGGFATVFAVADIGGRTPVRPLLVKAFDDAALAGVSGGAGRIAAGLADLIGKLEYRAGGDWLEQLLALPFHVAFVTGPNGATLAALMLDLRALGYEPSPFGDTAEMARYLARPATERQELAASFAAKAELLEAIGFVHGDLNGQNLLLAHTRQDVQVIDVDAGVLVVRGDERPLTPGKPDGFMPPEVKRPTAPGQIDMTFYAPTSERWSVACVIGYLIFGAHPGFFLEEISAASIDAYAGERPGWPELDRGSPLFTSVTENRAAYAAMRTVFDALPEDVTATFRALFAAGLDPGRRPAAAEWTRALTVLRSPPCFVEAAADGDCLIKGMPASVSWNAEGAASVEVLVVSLLGEARSLGSFGSKASTTTELAESAGFVLLARNPRGEARAIVGPVRVLPPPPRPPRPTRPRTVGTPSPRLRGVRSGPSLPSAPPLRPVSIRGPRPIGGPVR
jgi:serine/threonine protein kinase